MHNQKTTQKYTPEFIPACEFPADYEFWYTFHANGDHLRYSVTFKGELLSSGPHWRYEAQQHYLRNSEDTPWLWTPPTKLPAGYQRELQRKFRGHLIAIRGTSALRCLWDRVLVQVGTHHWETTSGRGTQEEAMRIAMELVGAVRE